MVPAWNTALRLRGVWLTSWGSPGNGNGGTGSGASDGGNGLMPRPETTSGQTTVWLQVVRQPTEPSGGFTLVYVPTALRNAGQGFRFTLPQTLQDEDPVSIRVSTVNGQPLPSWLQFDSQTRTFVASGVPPGGLPLRVRVISGRQQQVLELLEANT